MHRSTSQQKMTIPVLSLICILALSACGDTQGQRALSGGAIGAGVGAVGSSLVGGSALGGAVVGGAAGAATGAFTNKHQIDLDR